MPRKQTYQISDNDDLEYGKSRSQKKRESTALQKMGERLVALSSSELDAMPMTPSLADAVSKAKAMPPKSEALRRQMQYIGRLMREDADTEALAAALAELADKQASDTRAAHLLEARREELVAAAPEARTALCAEWGLSPDLAKQAVTLAAQAQNERDNGRPPKAYRALFRLLRDGE